MPRRVEARPRGHRDVEKPTDDQRTQVRILVRTRRRGPDPGRGCRRQRASRAIASEPGIGSRPTVRRGDQAPGIQRTSRGTTIRTPTKMDGITRRRRNGCGSSKNPEIQPDDRRSRTSQCRRRRAKDQERPIGTRRLEGRISWGSTPKRSERSARAGRRTAAVAATPGHRDR